MFCHGSVLSGSRVPPTDRSSSDPRGSPRPVDGAAAGPSVERGLRADGAAASFCGCIDALRTTGICLTGDPAPDCATLAKNAAREPVESLPRIVRCTG